MAYQRTRRWFSGTMGGMNEDTPQVARKRAREMRTISQMVALYCAANHAEQDRTQTAHCGEALCPGCAAIDAYAVERTQRCRKMEVKTTCEECENRCYQPQMREQIRAVMRFAGPRMITKHPVAAIRHLLGR
ncbi:MAG: nitrous oxide-stimulated promoter family protein [Coriobacteriales bacterium]